MKEYKKNKFLVLILIVFFIIVTQFYIYINNFLVLKTIIKENQYNGLIEKKEFRKNDKGLPYFYINNEWVYLSRELGSDIIEVGDSIVKEKNSDIIKIYKKNNKGKWQESIYKIK